MAAQRATIRLRTETAELRGRVERELDLFSGRTSWLDYRLYLFRMYGFHAPVERALGVAPELASVVPDAALRNNKVALLSHDLVSLGVERRDLQQLPRIAVPPLRTLPDALGWMYVLEASTLETKRLARQLAPQLPLEIESAAAYLDCYGDEVDARWRAFEASIDHYAAQRDTADALVAAATDCLSRLHRWLKPSAPVRVARALA